MALLLVYSSYNLGASWLKPKTTPHGCLILTNESISVLPKIVCIVCGAVSGIRLLVLSIKILTINVGEFRQFYCIIVLEFVTIFIASACN